MPAALGMMRSHHVAYCSGAILLVHAQSSCRVVVMDTGLLMMQGTPQEQLALPLMVMLAQQRRYIAVQTETGPLKLIAELYDKAQESLYLVSQHRWPSSLCLTGRRLQ